MKKMIESLAVLAMMITAAVLASCNKAEVEQVSSDRIATVTIAPPTVLETKVTTSDNGSKLTITGWEKDDIVLLYKVFEDGNGDWDAIEVEFECTDPSTGTFTSVDPLPTEVSSVEELNLALYNCKLDTSSNIDEGNAIFRFGTKVSQDLKDAIAMASVKNSEGKYQMKVVNDIVKVRNEKSTDTDAIWKALRIENSTCYYVVDMFFSANVKSGAVAYDRMTTGTIMPTMFSGYRFKLAANADNYLPICPGDDEEYSMIGLSAESDAADVASLISFKETKDIAASGVIYTAPNILPDPLSGKFVVNADYKKVQFSAGNLQAKYNGSSYDWGFAANQYDYIGAAAGNTTIGDSQTEGAAVDLFGFSTDSESNNYGIQNVYSSTTYTGNFKDWGEALGNGWRTLSIDEWKYLLKERVGASDKVGYATVNGKNGIILIPDYSYNDPNKNGGSKAFAPSSTKGYDANVYDGEDWTAMEAVGAVFLPAAGYRDPDDHKFYGDGQYWSTSEDIVKFYCDQHASSIDPNNYKSNRQNGLAVRLVKDAK